MICDLFESGLDNKLDELLFHLERVETIYDCGIVLIFLLIVYQGDIEHNHKVKQDYIDLGHTRMRIALSRVFQS